MDEFFELIRDFRAGNHLALLELPELVVRHFQGEENSEMLGGDPLIDLLLFVLIKLNLNESDYLGLKYFKGLMEYCAVEEHREERGRIYFCYGCVWQACLSVFALQASNTDLTPLKTLSLETKHQNLEAVLTQLDQSIKEAIDSNHVALEEELFSLNREQFLFNYLLARKWQQCLVLGELKALLINYLEQLDDGLENTDSIEQKARVGSLIALLKKRTTNGLQLLLTDEELQSFATDFSQVIEALASVEEQFLFKEFISTPILELIEKRTQQAEMRNELAVSFFSSPTTPLFQPSAKAFKVTV